MLHENVSLHQGVSIDSEARVYLQALDPAVQQLTGQLYGPTCRYARTLRGTFNVRDVDTADRDDLRSAEIYITDPCYWTPRLPFLYELTLSVATDSGEPCEHKVELGFSRAHLEAGYWKIEGKRIVFRGARTSVDDATLVEAHEAETTVIVACPDNAMLRSADEIGVALIVDLTGGSTVVTEEINKLTWHPSVMGVLLNARQLSEYAARRRRGNRIAIGAVLDARSRESEPDSVSESDFLAVDVSPSQRPPAWIAQLNKPLIAIRHGQEYAELAVARAACDRLQADLAPEFDLAGYFVAP